MNQEFTTGSTYKNDHNNTYIKSKIKEFGDMMETNNKVPKVKTPDKCLSLIKLESILRTKGNSYFLQVFLEECNYDVKEIKRNRQIDYDFEKSSSDESHNKPDS